MKAFITIFLLLTATLPAQQQELKERFQRYLEECPSNEIRFLYFLNDHPAVGMVMSIDISKYSVMTVRETSFAFQNQKTRELIPSQISKVNTIIKKLPSSENNIPYEKTLFVAYQINKKPYINRYNRQKPPQEIERLYDIGGGYLSYGKTEQGAAANP